MAAIELKNFAAAAPIKSKSYPPYPEPKPSEEKVAYKLKFKFMCFPAMAVLCLPKSHNPNIFTIASNGKSIFFWDHKNVQTKVWEDIYKTWRKEGEDEKITTLAISLDQKTLAIGGKRLLSLWQIETGKIQKWLGSNSFSQIQDIYALYFISQTHLVSIGTHNGVISWNIPSVHRDEKSFPVKLYRYYGYSLEIQAVHHKITDEYAHIFASAKGTYFLESTKSFAHVYCDKTKKSHKFPHANISCFAAFSPSEKYLATDAWQKFPIQIWDVKNNSFVKEISWKVKAKDLIQHLSFLTDHILVVGTHDGIYFLSI